MRYSVYERALDPSLMLFLDDNAVDRSVYRRSVVPSSGAVVGRGALDAHGTGGSYLRVGDEASFDWLAPSLVFSTAFWMRANVTFASARQYVFDTALTNDTTPGTGFLLSFDIGARLELRVRNAGVQKVIDAARSGNYASFFGPGGARTGNWVLVAMTYDKSRGTNLRPRFYANGETVGVYEDSYDPENLDEAPTSTTHPLDIGRKGEGLHEPLNSTLRLIRIWNRELSPDEIMYMYRREAPLMTV